MKPWRWHPSLRELRTPIHLDAGTTGCDWSSQVERDPEAEHLISQVVRRVSVHSVRLPYEAPWRCASGNAMRCDLIPPLPAPAHAASLSPPETAPSLPSTTCRTRCRRWS